MNGAHTAAGRLVLIVDDHELNVKLLRDVLNFAGFRTAEAGTAEAGLARAQAERPDVILLDVALPGIGGVEALHRLRGDAATAGIPVVAVTASAMTGDRERLLAEGFDAYVPKPIRVRALVDLVRDLGEAGR